MSHTTSQLSPQYQNQILLQVNGCRWAWCRLTFPTNSDLVQHVIHDHVLKAVPVMRKEIPILRRAEEGLGESLSISGFLTSQTPYCEDSSNSKGKQSEDVSAEVQPSSSLPSPPASSPTSISPLPPLEDSRNDPAARESSDEDSDSEGPSEYQDRDSSTPPLSSRLLSDHDAPFVAENNRPKYGSPITPFPVGGARMLIQNVTPSFAALSSPADSDSPLISSLPPTPSFNSQVEGVIGKRKRDDGSQRSPAVQRAWYRTSSDSNSSTESHKCVEDQLTQSMDIEEHTLGNVDIRQPSKDYPAATGNRCAYVECMAESSRTPNSQSGKRSQAQVESLPQSPTPLDSHIKRALPLTISTANMCASPAAVVTPVHMSRQAWYGTRPLGSAVKIKRNASATGSRDSRSSSRSRLVKTSQTKAEDSGRSFPHSKTNPNVFRSGTLQFTTADLSLENSGTPDGMDLSQSQSETQESSLGYSFPPLQTQAPYQSQSMSQ